MTTRTSGTGFQYEYLEEKMYDGSGTYIGSNWHHTSVPNWYRHHAGSDTPNFHKRVRNKELLPVNTFNQEEWGFTSLSGGWSLTRTSDGRRWESSHPLPTSYSLPYTITQSQKDSYLATIDYDDLVQASVAKLNAQFDALTFIAEFRHVPKMLAGAAKRLGDLVSDPTTKKLADGWLEVRYGWRPLFNDLKNIHDILTEVNDKSAEFLRTRTQQSLVFTETSSSPLVYGSWYGDLSLQATTTLISRGFAVTKGIRPKFLFDPIVTAYELLPYSFVVDWIVDIGQSLEALSALRTHGTTVTGAGYQLEIDASTFVTGSGHNGFTGYVDHSTAYKEKVNVRSPHPISLVPSFKLNIDVLKSIDLIAMMRQRF